jgi:serine/threonine-protein kinase
VSVLDWGVAKVQARDDAARGDPAATPGPGDTADGVVMGTPGFMAPEQLAGDLRSIDARTDVFGLGAILRSVSAVVTSGNPRVFAAIVARATASRPAERYSDARALADDLRRWMDGEPVAAYRESLLERVGRHYRRNRTLVLLLSAYAIMRVAFYVWRGF